jgi:hypothetical protein
MESELLVTEKSMEAFKLERKVREEVGKVIDEVFSELQITDRDLINEEGFDIGFRNQLKVALTHALISKHIAIEKR